MTTIPAVNIERVTPDQVDELHQIIQACGLDMKERLGLGHWDPPYPLDELRLDAAERAVYAVRNGDRAVATFTVGTAVPRHEWDGLRALNASVWAEPEARALYLNRLAVLPEIQGSGLGHVCLETVESIARIAGCSAVRFDAYEENEGLLTFYERAGYEQRGMASSRGYRFVCFEKRIA